MMIFEIPLYLGHTVTNIRGKQRVEGVSIAKVDDCMQPMMETAFDIECDTLLLSVGLIPENEISKKRGVQLSPITSGPVVDHTMETNIPGIFACGNVVHVNDLVDNVTTESELAGKFAALYAQGRYNVSTDRSSVIAGDNVRYVTPNTISTENIDDSIKFYFRVTQPARDVFVKVMIKRQASLHKEKRRSLTRERSNLWKIKKETLLRDRIEEVKISVTA